MDTNKLTEICKLGQGKVTCRYLTAGAGGFKCAKHNLGLASMINAQVESKAFNAQGDNCEGEGENHGKESN